MKIKVHVTKEILERTKFCGGDIMNCAVALAVREIAPKALVSSCMIYWNFNWSIKSIESIMPTDMEVFIEEFDSKKPEERAKMQPHTFELEFPNEMIEEIGIEQAHEIISKSLTLDFV